MGSVIVCGGGIVGLSAAMMLAADGHAVTVLEADPDPVPAAPERAWEAWRRAGVAQFRQPNGLQARFRQVCDQELPGLTGRLQAAGCVWDNYRHPLPPGVTDRSPRADDEAARTITGRRPVVEAVIAGAAQDQPGVTVRRGVRVTGLLPGPSALPGVPHAAGVATSTGEQLTADLVIDATGRRSRSPAWLAALGARPPQVDTEDHRFVYYTRYFTGPTPPPRRAPVLTSMGSFLVLTLVGDNHTWSVTLVATTADPALKALRHPDCFTRVVAGCPLHAHWLDGRPITGVLAIAGVTDRHRRFVLDGQPVITGFAAVGDAWACTNPTGGRGLSIGLMHAQQLRHTVAQQLRPAGRPRPRLRPAHRRPGRPLLLEQGRRRPRPARRDDRPPPPPGPRPARHPHRPAAPRRGPRPGRLPRTHRHHLLPGPARTGPRPPRGENRGTPRAPPPAGRTRP